MSVISAFHEYTDALPVGKLPTVCSFGIWCMMMMNCFCGMVDRGKAYTLISIRDHCQRSSPLRSSNAPRVGFEAVQNLSSGFVE